MTKGEPIAAAASAAVVTNDYGIVSTAAKAAAAGYIERCGPSAAEAAATQSAHLSTCNER